MALWIAAVTIAAVTGLITPVAALALALAVLAPYVYVSALHPSARSALPLPPRLRSWLAGAVAEEEQELAEAIHPDKGGPRDAALAVLALAVVVAASAAMERTASTLGARWAVPGVITGGIVLAAVTSMPNAVAAVFLARRGRASATLSEAFNSNTLNVRAGLLIPAVIITSTGPSEAPCELPSGTASLTVAHHRPGPGRTRHQPPQRRPDHRRLPRLRRHGHSQCNPAAPVRHNALTPAQRHRNQRQGRELQSPALPCEAPVPKGWPGADAGPAVGVRARYPHQVRHPRARPGCLQQAEHAR